MSRQNERRFKVGGFITGLALVLMALAVWVQSPLGVIASSALDLLHHQGYITSRPEGTTGLWVIGGHTFVANGDTQFNESAGQLNVSGCATVHYERVHDANIAKVIAGESAEACTVSATATPSPSETPHPTRTPAPTDSSIVRGILNSRPSTGKVGIWVIGEQSFTATDSTELNEVQGGLSVGACVRVRFEIIEEVAVAKAIARQPAEACNPNTTSTPSPSETPHPTRTATPTDSAIVRGILNSRPSTGKVGIWMVGDRSFTANGSTELNEVQGGLSIGVCVRVRFEIIEEVAIAKAIARQPAEACNTTVTATPTPSETPHDSHAESRIFAKVDSLPALPYTGTWSIGGIAYVADSETKFEQDAGPFTVNGCVKAEFIRGNDVNRLKAVETEDAYKCETDSTGGPTNNFKAYGAIDIFSTTVPSEWVVSGITYTVDGNTKQQQEHGAFAVGGFVEVQYAVSGTVRIATLIKTHVAPGEGLENHVGMLTSRPSDDWGTWVINGVSYQGDPAIVVELSTDIQAQRFSVTSADTTQFIVHVNAYINNGIAYATLIRGLADRIYMPVLQQ